MKQTDHKAWAGALATIASVAASRLLVELPIFTAADYPLLAESLEVILLAAIGYAVVYVSPQNRVKELSARRTG